MLNSGERTGKLGYPSITECQAFSQITTDRRPANKTFLARSWKFIFEKIVVTTKNRHTCGKRFQG
jgi:hypothetical protein